MATKPSGTKLYKMLNIFFYLLFLDHAQFSVMHSSVFLLSEHLLV